jgi:aminoglycoside phosphotransferase (APT) family kinase protein
METMPPAEVEVTTDLVEALLADQRPELLDHDLVAVPSGWDNFLVRIGDHLLARLPRRALAAHLVLNEARWLPVLAPLLPIPVPVPVHVGEPGHEYPWSWTIVPWIPGVPAGDTEVEPEAGARDLAAFLKALHLEAPRDAPDNPYRGRPLSDRDEPTRQRIDRLSGSLDVGLATLVWEEALEAPALSSSPVWLHGDLHPGNLLTADGSFVGVIDFGDITAGDPATDLSVAWMLFDSAGRGTFRQAYGSVDDATWTRARGWALSLGTAYLAFSADNPMMERIGQVTLRRVLAAP